MGIDGIGGKPPIGPGAGALGPTSPNGEGFSLERNAGVGGAEAGHQASATTDVSTTEALDRFRAGELSLDEYMDTRVEKAVAHVATLLPPEQLEMLKEQLKDQMRNDPGVRVLVQRTTGALPSDAGLDDNG